MEVVDRKREEESDGLPAYQHVTTKQSSADFHFTWLFPGQRYSFWRLWDFFQGAGPGWLKQSQTVVLWRLYLDPCFRPCPLLPYSAITQNNWPQIFSHHGVSAPHHQGQNFCKQKPKLAFPPSVASLGYFGYGDTKITNRKKTRDRCGGARL